MCISMVYGCGWTSQYRRNIYFEPHMYQGSPPRRKSCRLSIVIDMGLTGSLRMRTYLPSAIWLYTTPTRNAGSDHSIHNTIMNMQRWWVSHLHGRTLSHGFKSNQNGSWDSSTCQFRREACICREERGQTVWIPLKSNSRLCFFLLFPIGSYPWLVTDTSEHPRTHSLQPMRVGEGIGFCIWATFFWGFWYPPPFFRSPTISQELVCGL